MSSLYHGGSFGAPGSSNNDQKTDFNNGRYIDDYGSSNITVNQGYDSAVDNMRNSVSGTICPGCGKRGCGGQCGKIGGGGGNGGGGCSGGGCGGGGGGKGGGPLGSLLGSAVCTAAVQLGRLSPEVLEAESKILPKLHQWTKEGYWLWGVPLSKLMLRKTLVADIVVPICKLWAEIMAKDEGLELEISIPRLCLGRVMIALGKSVCFLIGGAIQLVRRISE